MADYKVYKKLSKKVNKNGTAYFITLYVHSSVIATYTYAYGDSADWWTGGSSTYIADAQYLRANQHYYVVLTAYSAGYETSESSGSFNYQTASTTFRTYDDDVLFFQPDWWGATRATSADVGVLDIYGNEVESTGYANQYVYAGAASEDTGSPDFSRCPLAKDDSDSEISLTEMPLTYLGQKVHTIKYSIRLLKNNAIDDYAEFVGVNPTDGFGAASTKPNDDSKHLWLAVHQTVSEDAVPVGGTLYDETRRIMLRAPKLGNNQLYWNSTKKGGEWTW